MMTAWYGDEGDMQLQRRDDHEEDRDCEMDYMKIKRWRIKLLRKISYLLNAPKFDRGLEEVW